MISIDGSVVIQIINFIVLIWAMNVVLYKPIRKMLAERSQKFNELERTIQTFNQQVEEKINAWSLGLKEARAKGLAEKESLIRAAAEEEKRLIEKINSKAQADLEEIRKKIAQDALSVREALQKELEPLANAISQKILGRAV
ncbi:MAG: ATPase [Thermodesulfobacteriota bacterium]